MCSRLSKTLRHFVLVAFLAALALTDQWISAAATNWTAMALAFTTDVPPKEHNALNSRLETRRG